MGKDKSEKRDKKDKKEKKEKRREKVDEDGVAKKSKKEKKSKLNEDNIAAAYEEVTKTKEAQVQDPMEVESAVDIKAPVLTKESTGETILKPVGALVPFANPLADEKVTKKVLKGVKKGMHLIFYSLNVREKLIGILLQLQKIKL